jgi:hypothetical protein
MRKAGIFLLTLILTLALSGLAIAIHEGSDGTGEGPGILADGPNLWKHISEDNPYTKWALWPGKGKLYAGTEPHGMLLTTYVSKGAKKTIKGKKGLFSGGAIIVKENYKPDKTLAAITVMYKAKAYNPEAGDWFWAKYKPDGTVDKAGKVGGCIKCHSAKADNDWVFTGSITDLPPANAAAVWEYISDEKKYTKWPLWPGTKKLYDGTQPHGMLLTTYVSKDAKKVIKKKQGEFGHGALIVKENYKPDKTLAAITVMYKKSGYNPEAGDWYWAKYQPDGTVDKEGKVQGCIKCHSAKADNDWVFTGEVK